jgi:hypothetical protein
MITFVIKRLGHKAFDDMIEKWNWLEKNFGKCSYDQTTWTWYFHCGTEDYVDFVMYDEAIATWFKLQFPEVQTLNEFDEKVILE